MNPWTVLVSVAALGFVFATGINVAVIRRRYGVFPPAMAGHPKVECALRVQGNTLEWIVIFLPALWMFSAYWDARVGAAIGAVWILGRILYLIGYMSDPGKRGPGFGLQALCTFILLIGAGAGAVMALV